MSLEKRIAKLENAAKPPAQRAVYLTIEADNCGGEIMSPQTEAQAIAAHLKQHPEHEGRQFQFMRIEFLHGCWNDTGQFICDTPECRNFGAVIDLPARNAV